MDSAVAPEPVLDLRNLQIRYGSGTPVVSNVDLAVQRGEVVGLIGESGCGKSTVALSVLRLLPPSARISADRFALCGDELLGLNDKQMNARRAKVASIVFQEPMTALNPCMRIGRQIGEVIRLKDKTVSWKDAEATAVRLLGEVQVPNPERRAQQYPHELSGGMRQRVMIAMATALSPALLVADEPTTALDVTVQAQILDLLRALHDRSGMSVLLITHDIGVIAEMCDRVVVMYAGVVVEQGAVADVLRSPAHPYTWALLQAMPRVDTTSRQDLVAIPGWISDDDRAVPGCRFQKRCAFAEERCAQPQRLHAVGDREVRCWKANATDWLARQPAGSPV